MKVEEYRQGRGKLRDTANFLKNKIAFAKEKIARAEGELSRLDIYETDLKFAAQRETLALNLKNFEQETTTKREFVKKYDERESSLNELKLQRDKFQSAAATAGVFLKQKEAEKNLSQNAAEKIKILEKTINRTLQRLANSKISNRNAANATV